jgi:L-alanine-DL-glutamate epimerase-like enolase superfamily enzyme
LFDHPIDAIASIQTVLEHLERDCLRTGQAYHSALGAIDLALLDALERSQRIRPEHLFPETRRDALRFSVSVPFLPLEVITKYFPRFETHFDIAVIKVLVSEDIEETYERVKLLHQLAQPDTEIRLEFNGKMTFSRVQKILARLVSLGVRAVEEPLPAGRLNELQRLRDQFDLNFVADESLVTLDDAERLIKSKAYDIFNIKVSKCGGLLKSMRIAKLAQRHGIRCQIGTHVGESKLLGIAGRRLARSLPNFDCYGGGSEVLFSHLFESPQPLAAVPWPPPADRDIMTDEACRELAPQHRLLGDTADGVPHEPPGP